MERRSGLKALLQAHLQAQGAGDRVREMADGEGLRFGNRELTLLHTRGDAFGLHYPVLQEAGPFAFPSTTPTDFDGELAIEAVRRIVALQPSRVYPTHFGEVTAIETTAGQLIRHLEFAQALMLDAQRSDRPDDLLYDYVLPRLRDYYAGLLDGLGELGRRPEMWELLALDLDINAQGLALAANKRRRKAREAQTS